MKSMPHILKFMSAMPHTIGSDQPLNRALEIMRQHRIRHLPVLDGGKLVGVLSDRDVKLGASFADSEELTVDDVMTPEPYSVLPEAPVNRVVSEMAEKKYGCAVVQQENGKVVGIFTANDGLRVLADQLDAFYRPADADAHVRSHG
ncbi:MAG: CBS domain-containing protein [Bdellovibrionales bacterium]|nr:CBS domain-containing protein [Bdellovibrionales bacterium]